MIDIVDFVSSLIFGGLALMFILCYITLGIIIYHDLHESERGNNGDKNKKCGRR